jgi:inorganic pyrophosphatase
MNLESNSWHSVENHFKGDIVEGIIEIPKGSRAKYELDKDSGLLRLDRVLYSSVYYPANYGFIPKTYCDDKDPLDILVISQIDIVPMCLVSAKIIGVMRMLDQGEADDKIIAVAPQIISPSNCTQGTFNRPETVFSSTSSKELFISFTGNEIVFSTSFFVFSYFSVVRIVFYLGLST